jgi:predicted nucleotidyltransferase
LKSTDRSDNAGIALRGSSVTWADVRARLGITREALLADVEAKLDMCLVHGVYVGGSIADGYGNERSDVDVYVLISEASRPPSNGGFEVSMMVHRTLQYDFVSLEQLDKAIEQFEGRAFEDASVSIATNQVLHRLMNGVVVYGPEVVHRYRERLAHARYCAFSSHVKEMQSENALQDAYGAWESQQFETATINIRLATQRAFEAVLSLCGQTATNEKWVFEKAALALGKEHAAYLHFRDLYSRMPARFDPEGVAEYFGDSLAFLQLCFDATVASALVPSAHGDHLGELSQALLQRTLQGPTRKNCRIHLKRHRGRILVHDAAVPTREMSERAALVWIGLGIVPTLVESVSLAQRLRPDIIDEGSAAGLAPKLEAAWLKTGMLLR